MTEHGIPYQARASGGRSHRRSRRSHDLPGGLGNPVVGRRATGEPLEPDAATRNAQRPKGEKRQLASRLPGNSYGRCAPRGALWYPCCKQEELRRGSWVTGISGGESQRRPSMPGKRRMLESVVEQGVRTTRFLGVKLDCLNSNPDGVKVCTYR
jgi:hypothetical protein